MNGLRRPEKPDRDPCCTVNGEQPRRSGGDFRWLQRRGLESFIKSNPGLSLAGGQPTSTFPDYKRKRSCWRLPKLIMAARDTLSGRGQCGLSPIHLKRAMQLSLSSPTPASSQSEIDRARCARPTACQPSRRQLALTKGRSDHNRGRRHHLPPGSSHGEVRRAFDPSQVPHLKVRVSGGGAARSESRCALLCNWRARDGSIASFLSISQRHTSPCCGSCRRRQSP